MGEMRPKCHDQEQKRHFVACYFAVHDTFPRFTPKNATASAARDGIRVDAGDGSVRALFLRDGHVALEIFPAPSLALPESSLSAEDPSDKDIFTRIGIPIDF